MYMDKEGFLVMCGVEIATVAGFIWYISLPVDYEKVELENDGGNTNYIGNDLRGVINNGQNNSNENETEND